MSLPIVHCRMIFMVIFLSLIQEKWQHTLDHLFHEAYVICILRGGVGGGIRFDEPLSCIFISMITP